METKELTITPPEGYEIDKENSTFERVILKKKEVKRWRDDKDNIVSGYIISYDAKIASVWPVANESCNYNIFFTKKQAKSARAMARISQIMVRDKRFGLPITSEEWENLGVKKHSITRHRNKLVIDSDYYMYNFLSFHTAEQRDLFLQENEDLVRDYLML